MASNHFAGIDRDGLDLLAREVSRDEGAKNFYFG
jgi:hypothetical protein